MPSRKRGLFFFTDSVARFARVMGFLAKDVSGHCPRVTTDRELIALPSGHSRVWKMHLPVYFTLSGCYVMLNMSDTLDTTIDAGESIDTPDTVIKSIYAGEYDADIDRLVTAVQTRKKHLVLQLGWQLQPGDRVQIVSGRPRYIIGEQATVTKVMQTYVSIRLDNAIGKFSNMSSIRCPMAMLAKIPPTK